MFQSLYTAASGMFAQQKNMEEISENLSNVTTNAYKKGRIDFEDLVYNAMAEPGAMGSYGDSLPVGSQVGTGVKTVSIQKTFTPGELLHTGNPLDLGIHGEGFFQVKLEDGTVGYTRDGVIRLTPQGELLMGGHPVVGVKVPHNATGIEIEENGTVKAFVNNNSKRQKVGQLKLFRFLNPGGLRMTENVYLESPVSGTKVQGIPGQKGLGVVKSGYVEKANVNLVEEMMAMVLAQKAYEINAKAVQASDEMMRTTTALKSA